MAHNELALDSNAIDVAFSKSGTRIAVLMIDRFSIFLWSLKSRPVPVPILESSYPLSDEKHSRPRQIAFINDNEVFVLRNRAPDNTCIERTTLETRKTKVAYEASSSEQLVSISTSLGHEALWFSNVPRPGQTVAYSRITMPTLDEFRINPWTQSPAVDTYWAKSVQVSGDEVRTKTIAMDSSLIFSRRS
jgi:elongator complex protein 1